MALDITTVDPVRQAVVLAGGLGSRLGELTRSTPKPLLPVAGRPFLAYLFDRLSRIGIEEIVVSTGHLPDAFADFLAGYASSDPYGRPVRTVEARERVRAGTAGALRLMADRLDERFLLVNGDTFFDCDLASVIGEACRLARGEMLVTVREVADAGLYGTVQIDAEGRVSRFIEKGGNGPGLVNAGAAVLDRQVVDLIDTLPCSLEQEVYPRLADAGRLFATERSGYFIDIGLPETYGRAQTELPAQCTRPAVFFDRDGVLNIDAGYTHRSDELSFIQGAPEAVRMARAAGYATIVVTNQAGVAKGHYDESDIGVFHRHMNARLREVGGWIDAFYYCPYHPEATVPAYRQVHSDRKPEPGMILRAIDELSLNSSRSFLIGDSETDMEAARRAGIRGYRYTSGGVDEVMTRALSEGWRTEAT